MEKEIKTIQKKFLFVMIVLAIVVTAYFFEGRMNVQNTTAYLLTYEYGFIPRGFIGTIIGLLTKMFNVTMSYRLCMIVSVCATVVYFILIFQMYKMMLDRTDTKNINNTFIIMVFLSIFMFPMFLTWNNFGRLDEFLIIIVIMCMCLLIGEKYEWLIIPLCGIACLIHVGFVFTNSGLILALLLVKVLDNEGEKKKKYRMIFILTFCVISIIFLYLEIFRQPISISEYKSIEHQTYILAEEGGNLDNIKDAYSLLKSELLLDSVYVDESVWRERNRLEFPVFLTMFLPYILMLFKFFAGLFKGIKTKKEGVKYLVVLLGVATILPELILKVDYGRWMFSIVLYYILIILFLYVTKDEGVNREVNLLFEKLSMSPGVWVLIIYPMLFMPFRDVYISDLTKKIMDFIAGIFGLW